MRKDYKNLTLFAALFCLLFSFSSLSAEEIKEPIQAALDQGDTAQAIELLNHEIEVDKGYHYNYYILGRIYFAQEKYNKARDNFEIALEKKSKHYLSMYYLGLTYLQLGDIDKALKEMETGRKKARDEKYLFYNGYGLVMLAQEKYDDAVKAFLQALVDHEDNPEYHINLGDAYFYQGVPSLAVLEFEKAQQLDTASTEVYFHWAEACFQMRDYNCTMEKLKTVLSKDSTHAPAWRRAGGIYFKAALSARTMADRINRFKEAIGSYNRYLELSKVEPDSSSVRTFFELGMAYVNLNGFDEAVKYFKNVLSIPMEPKDIYFYYGKALWGMKEFEKATDALLKQKEWEKQQDEEYKSSFDDWEYYQLLGDSYFYRKPNDFTNAIAYYKKSLEDKPDQKRIVLNVAKAYNILKSNEQALEYYQMRIALGVDTSECDIYRNAGYCALSIANNQDAGGGNELDDLESMEGDQEVLPASSTEDADVDYSQFAIDYLTKYLECSPGDTKAMMWVASTYLEKKNCTEGVKWLEKILSLEPDNCDALKSLGFAYFGEDICTQSYTKALGYLRRAYECVSKSGKACDDPKLVLWIAQCYHLRAVKKTGGAQEDDFKNAFDWYEKTLKCDPTNVEAKEGADQVRYEF